MQGDAIGYLNRALVNVLMAINQYFLHARMCKNWGFHKLNDYEYRLSIGRMRQADRLIERILFLDERPHLKEFGRPKIGGNVPEMLACDLRLELESLPLLKEAIAACEQLGDFISRELFEHILENEEEHIDWLETQLELIEKIGLPDYLQSGL